MDRPNVLFLYTDQQRADTIRAAGNPHILTPNLDRLAEQGVLLDNAFCNSPVCMPSRQSMLSGRYPSTVGCRWNGVEMPEDVPTIATILKPHGYHTANIGKLHFKNHSNRDHRGPHPAYGFDTLILSDEPGCYDDAYIEWVGAQDPAQVEECRCSTPPAWTGEPVRKHPRRVFQPYVFEGREDLTHSAFVASETADFIRRHREEPFFCIAGFYAPHAPINPPQRFVDVYDPAVLPLPAMNEGEDLFGLSDDEWRRVKAYYYALVSHVDDQVGRILDALDETGLRENTIVIFTADHGEHLGDHGRVAKGAPGFDSCAHVPLVLSYPEVVEAGQRFGALIEAVDLAPTIADLCGVEAPPFFQGRSFAELLRGGGYEERSSAFIELLNPFKGGWKALRTQEFKYCVSSLGEELLFDLQADPCELHNVVGEPAYEPALHELRMELIRRWFSVENQYPLRTGEY